MTKSREAIWDLLRAQASRPYKSTGTHLLLINCSTTSSEATLLISEYAVGSSVKGAFCII